MKSINISGAVVRDYTDNHGKYTENRDNDVFIDVFDSLTELDDYNETTSLNKWFANCCYLASRDETYDFTGTHSYEQARDYMLNGWHTQAAKLNANLRVANKNRRMGPTTKRGYSVVGYGTSVPRFCMGLPTNMVNQIKTVGRDKVITVVKSLNYGASYTTEEIEKESIKALQIVQTLESNGYSVNLYVSAITGGHTNYFHASNGCVIKIKRAGERLNISKLAYPMVNPSMKRRNIFAWRERAPHITKSYAPNGYGRVVSDYESEIILHACWDDKIVYLPAVIREDLTKIRDVNELDKHFNIRA